MTISQPIGPITFTGHVAHPTLCVNGTGDFTNHNNQITMRTNHLTQLILLCALFLATQTLLFAQLEPIRRTAPPAEPDYTISRIQVTGTAATTIVPDEMEMNVTIRHENRNGQTAVENYRASRISLLDTLKEYGIADSMMTESGMLFGPYYDYQDEKDLYYAHSSVRIRVRDFERYPGLAIALTGIPGVSLSGSWYRASGISEIRDSIRLLAVAEARKKAEAMAAVCGVRLGRVLFMDEFAGTASLMRDDLLDYHVLDYDLRAGAIVGDSRLVVSRSFFPFTISVYAEFELVE